MPAKRRSAKAAAAPEPRAPDSSAITADLAAARCTIESLTREILDRVFELMVFDGDPVSSSRSLTAPYGFHPVHRYLLINRHFAASVQATLERFVAPQDAETLAMWASGLNASRLGRAEWLIVPTLGSQDFVAGVLIVAMPLLRGESFYESDVFPAPWQAKIARHVGSLPALRHLCWRNGLHDPRRRRPLEHLGAAVGQYAASLRMLALHDIVVQSPVTLAEASFGSLTELERSNWTTADHARVVDLLASITITATRLRYLRLACCHSWSGEDLLRVTKPVHSRLRVLDLDIDTDAQDHAPLLEGQLVTLTMLTECTELRALQVATMAWVDDECLYERLKRVSMLIVVKVDVTSNELWRLAAAISGGTLRHLAFNAVDAAGESVDWDDRRVDPFVVRPAAPQIR